MLTLCLVHCSADVVIEEILTSMDQEFNKALQRYDALLLSHSNINEPDFSHLINCFVMDLVTFHDSLVCFTTRNTYDVANGIEHPDLSFILSEFSEDVYNFLSLFFGHDTKKNVVLKPKQEVKQVLDLICEENLRAHANFLASRINFVPLSLRKFLKVRNFPNVTKIRYLYHTFILDIFYFLQSISLFDYSFLRNSRFILSLQNLHDNRYLINAEDIHPVVESVVRGLEGFKKEFTTYHHSNVRQPQCTEEEETYQSANKMSVKYFRQLEEKLASSSSTIYNLIDECSDYKLYMKYRSQLEASSTSDTVTFGWLNILRRLGGQWLGFISAYYLPAFLGMLAFITTFKCSWKSVQKTVQATMGSLGPYYHKTKCGLEDVLKEYDGIIERLYSHFVSLTTFNAPTKMMLYLERLKAMLGRYQKLPSFVNVSLLRQMSKKVYLEAFNMSAYMELSGFPFGVIWDAGNLVVLTMKLPHSQNLVTLYNDKPQLNLLTRCARYLLIVKDIESERVKYLPQFLQKDLQPLKRLSMISEGEKRKEDPPEECLNERLLSLECKYQASELQRQLYESYFNCIAS